jgi:circadian clock protein KaiC
MDADSSLEGDPVLLLSGVPGLDNVLGGGFFPRRLYLLEGVPGSGKTTIALQFLLGGRVRGEPVLYVTLSETAEELASVARSHGWNLEGIAVREMLPPESALDPDQQSTMFHPSEVELGEMTLQILKDVRRIQPVRVVIDSLSELRLLAGDALRYRRQILALKQFFAGHHGTVLMLDDMTAAERDLQVHSVAHAVIHLEQMHSEYGATRRRLVVTKYRGQAYRDGYHDYKIARGGLQVFPRLVAAEHPSRAPLTRIPSGVAELDELLGGGIERGTSTLIVGAPGTGKSSLATQYAAAAARRGEHSALFLFDESIATWRTRCEGMGMELAAPMASGHLRVRQVDPAELSPGEFIDELRQAVTVHKATVIVIDSLNGYLNAMPDERFLIAQLHELLTFLGQGGVATMLVGAQHGLIGMHMQTPVDASYLSDAVVMLRYYESNGEVMQAISVVKKRGGAHERTIRSFMLTSNGIVIGEPLRHYRGILTGVPVRERDTD